MQRRRSRAWRSAVLGAIVLGLLIWAKLRMVAGIPRTVLAEPRERAAAAEQAPRPR